MQSWVRKALYPSAKYDAAARQSAGVVAKQSTIFNTNGTLGGNINNIAGDYIAHVDEGSVSKISRMLSYAEGASWDSRLSCLEGTRLTMLSEIDTWAHQRDSKTILWLKGVAGSGKSAIAHTIAQKFHEECRLTSSFFFSRDTSTRNNPRLLFPTITRDLSSVNSSIAEDIATALENEPSLASASLTRQFKEFILKPSRRHLENQQVLIVIDALDESMAGSWDTELLTIFRDEAAHLPSNFRILITSRPMNSIEQFLRDNEHIVARHVDIYTAENRADIAKYVDAQLCDNIIRSKMGPDWPDEKMIENLKQMADGLFIWIATICNYLRTAYKARTKLQKLLSKSALLDLPPEKKMDDLYSSILNECGDWDDAEFLEDYGLIMGAIMAAKQPISWTALRALHYGTYDLDPEDLLQRFGSVLVGFQTPFEPIRILHVSFREFITSRASRDRRTLKFHISEIIHNRRLAELSIKTMNRELRYPMKGTGFLAKPSDDFPGIPRISGISEQLMYSCQYWLDHAADIEWENTEKPDWTNHLAEVEKKKTNDIRRHIINFISFHLVTWIEVVTSRRTFRGTLMIRQWLADHAPDSRHLYDDQAQGLLLFLLADRLSYAVRLEEALVVIKEAVVLYRSLAAEQPAAFNASLASCLNNLSNYLADLGQREEALRTIQEAVSIRRSLVAAQPVIFNADLAESLNNLSIRLQYLGRWYEALKVMQEVVELRRSLAADKPTAFNASLAGCLTTLAVHFLEIGRREEALALMKEAVALRRGLASERTSFTDITLASSVNRLSYCILELTRREDALQALQEAADLRRALEAKRPAALNALDSLSVHLSHLEKQKEAVIGQDIVRSSGALGKRPFTPDDDLMSLQGAVRLQRALAAQNPHLESSSLGLASSLKNLSNRLWELRQGEKALKMIQASVTLHRDLATKRPVAFNADLAETLENLSSQLSGLGQLEKALKTHQEVVNLRRTLARERPAAFNAPLSSSLYKLSKCLSSLGRDGEALTAALESVALRRALAMQRPAAYNPDLAESLDYLSQCLANLIRSEDALQAIQEAVDLRRVLADERPAVFSADLASSLNNLSNRWLDVCEPWRAHEAAKESVILYRNLVTERPAAFNTDLALSLSTLSTCLSELDERLEAVKTIQEAIGLYRTLAVGRPESFTSQLAAALTKLSIFTSELHLSHEALAAMQEATEKYRAIAQEQPGVVNPDLAVALSMLSKRFSVSGNVQEALHAVREAVEMYRVLVEQQPEKFKAAHGKSQLSLAKYESRLIRRQEALAAIQGVVDVRRALAAKQPALYNVHLAEALNRLSVCLSAVGRTSEAELILKEVTELEV